MENPLLKPTPTKCLAAVIAAVTLTASASASEIVHLRCELLNSAKTPTIWTIALDERAKTVSYQVNSFSGTKIAIFTADSVMWSKGRNIISRIDLSMTRNISIRGAEQRGQCKIITPPERAF